MPVGVFCFLNVVIAATAIEFFFVVNEEKVFCFSKAEVKIQLMCNSFIVSVFFFKIGSRESVCNCVLKKEKSMETRS